MSLARISLPVPLSPQIRTGMLASDTLAALRRNTCMASLRPKMTSSGGSFSAPLWPQPLAEKLADIGPNPRNIAFTAHHEHASPAPSILHDLQRLWAVHP